MPCISVIFGLHILFRVCAFFFSSWSWESIFIQVTIAIRPKTGSLLEPRFRKGNMIDSLGNSGNLLCENSDYTALVDGLLFSFTFLYTHHLDL